jgi:hypothetical protein
MWQRGPFREKLHRTDHKVAILQKGNGEISDDAKQAFNIAWWREEAI